MRMAEPPEKKPGPEAGKRRELKGVGSPDELTTTQVTRPSLCWSFHTPSSEKGRFMYRYKLKHRYSGSGRALHFSSLEAVEPWDVIEPDGDFYYFVIEVRNTQQRRSGAHLVLSESAQSPEEAELLAEQNGDRPKSEPRRPPRLHRETE